VIEQLPHNNMEHDDGLFGAKHEVIEWLKKNNLHSYQDALEEEG
jgi:hypothetical protein